MAHLFTSLAGFTARPGRAVEAFRIRHEVDQFGDRQPVAIVRHGGQPVRVDVPRTVDDQRVGIQDRLQQIAGLAASDAGEIGSWA